jgi:hypothetical protein
VNSLATPFLTPRQLVPGPRRTKPNNNSAANGRRSSRKLPTRRRRSAARVEGLEGAAVAEGRGEVLGAAYLLTSSRFRRKVRPRPRCGNSGAHLAAIREGVKRPWRRSHGENLNPATAVFPAVGISAKPSPVSVQFTATTAAMEPEIVCCARGCDIPASRPRAAVRQRRSLGSGNWAGKGCGRAA